MIIQKCMEITEINAMDDHNSFATLGAILHDLIPALLESRPQVNQYPLQKGCLEGEGRDGGAIMPFLLTKLCVWCQASGCALDK
jgi:hypothetical protein